VQARCPAVVVPFVAGAETEQLQRARRLEALGCAVVIEPPQLTADALAQAIARALVLSPAAPGACGAPELDGAAETARCIRRLSPRRGLG
jgi:predicted glycosyltransferase